MTTKVLNKLVNICTNLDSGTSDSSSEMTSVSRDDLSGNYVPFMKLTPYQINKFEGLVTASMGTTQGVTLQMYTYLKILAFGDVIINPIIYTTEVTEETTDMFLSLMKCTHNDSGDILLALSIVNTDSYNPTYKNLVIESKVSKTNSPTEYETLSRDDYTICDLTESTKYVSTISYKTFYENIYIYSKVGYATD